ncbi:MoaD/ThiS family protein [Candidatus Woesearchaeota archaeon]|nr:MoaD/ThiS family protein [Candidatus Woesearchaeota archaeon]
MKISVHIERTNTTQKIDFSGITVRQLLCQLDLNLETVLVARNNEVLTEEETLQENDLLEILSVISGG